MSIADRPQAVEEPVARFEPHAADMKFDWSRGGGFGFNGELFLAEFGDGSPLTTGLRPVQPRGFRVVRVNTDTGAVQPFLSVRNPGLESTRGPRRPIDVKFDASGDNLYLLDFGVMTVRVALNQVGINPLPHTGTVWRIRRTGATGTAPAVARADGGDLLSWWTVRPLVLEIRKDMREAVAHAQLARQASDPAQHSRHLEEARSFMDSIRTRVTLALKRVDEPNVIDDGTKAMLVATRDWAAGRNLHNPLAVFPDDRTIREVESWLETRGFPEKEYLRRTYALPGRWQRPVERDIRP